MRRVFYFRTNGFGNIQITASSQTLNKRTKTKSRMVGRAAPRPAGKMNGYFAIMATSDNACLLYAQNIIEVFKLSFVVLKLSLCQLLLDSFVLVLLKLTVTDYYPSTTRLFD